MEGTVKVLPDPNYTKGFTSIPVKFKGFTLSVTNVPANTSAVTTNIDAPIAAKVNGVIARWLVEHGPVQGDVFKALREFQRIKATDLANLLNCTPETISRWENGHSDIDRSAFVVLLLMAGEKLGLPNLNASVIIKRLAANEPVKSVHHANFTP